MAGKNVIDETGKVFGMLTVLERAVNNYTHKGKQSLARWKVKCVCGKEKVVYGQHLRQGRTKSCGCLIGRWKRYQFGQAARNYVFNYYKYSAKSKARPWQLNKEQFGDITSFNCHYCGAEPEKQKKLPSGTFVYNGIDRKDNHKGYTLDNVVPCCEICNLAKRDLTYEDFVSWLKRAGRHQNGELPLAITSSQIPS